MNYCNIFILLHLYIQISAVTAQSLTVYKDSVCKTCDAMDGNIKVLIVK